MSAKLKKLPLVTCNSSKLPNIEKCDLHHKNLTENGAIFEVR
jgi:hypothetical protein